MIMNDKDLEGVGRALYALVKRGYGETRENIFKIIDISFEIRATYIPSISLWSVTARSICCAFSINDELI
jgi:hypothetical protein